MNTAVTSTPGAYPHVEWIDLKGDGVLVECAVVKKDEFGNIYFIELRKLDRIDRQRMFRILTNRSANNFELWDLLSQRTLGNGMNALEYFHQLVKVVTPSGRIKRPRMGEVGFGQGRAGVVNTNVDKDKAAAE